MTGRPPIAGQDLDLLDASPFAEFAPVATVAAVLGRSRQTIHTWVRHGTVRSQLAGAVMLVHVLDAGRASGTRGRRRRLPKHEMSP